MDSLNYRSQCTILLMFCFLLKIAHCWIFRKIRKLILKIEDNLIGNVASKKVSAQFIAWPWKVVINVLQPFTKCSRQTLVFMWNSALRENFNFCFSGFFLLVLTKLSIQGEDWALGKNSMQLFFWYSLIIIKSFGNLWGNSYIPASY